MDFKSAILAAAHDAPQTAITALETVSAKIETFGALENELRVAHMIGQCAHESLRFTRVSESLFYTTGTRIFEVFRRHFRDLAEANKFTRNPEKLANRVYANRLGNGSESSGDGFRFRGRGYLQLTGRSNYRTFGGLIGEDLEGNPHLAEEPETAWMVAAKFLQIRKRSNKTAFQWADDNNVELVTRIVNGGTNGLEDRRNRTARALSALGGIEFRPVLRRGSEGDAVMLLQRGLAAKGFPLGAIDGDFGPRTESSVKAFQSSLDLTADGVVGPKTWEALEPLPS